MEKAKRHNIASLKGLQEDGFRKDWCRKKYSIHVVAAFSFSPHVVLRRTHLFETVAKAKLID